MNKGKNNLKKNCEETSGTYYIIIFVEKSEKICESYEIYDSFLL